MSSKSRLVELGSLAGFGANNYYDAASYDPIRDWGKMPSTCHEDLIFTSLTRQVAINRMRREIRNNPFLAGIVNRYPDCIGYSDLRSRTSDKKYNKEKNLFWYRYAKRIDISGMSLRTVERIAKRELLITGENFVVQLLGGKTELIPSEFCGSGATKRAGELEGIVYGPDNQPTAYRFGKMGKDGIIDYDKGTYVEAKFVIHVFNRDRVCMGRGLPWLLPSLPYARDLYEMTRKKFKQIKDANSLFAFLKKEGVNKWINGLPTPTAQNIEEESTEAGTEAADKTNKGTPKLALQEGTLLTGEPGDELVLLSGDYKVTDHKEISMYALHAMSAPIGLPVEIWFSGLGDVSFAGFKGIGTIWDDTRSEFCLWFESVFLDRLHFWRISLAVKLEELPPNPDDDDDLINWGWGRTPVLDLDKDASARKKRLDAGLSSLVEEWEAEGKFADEELAIRRAFWIEAMIAAGDIEEGADLEKVKVPLALLIYNRLDEPEPEEEPAAPAPTIDPNAPST